MAAALAAALPLAFAAPAQAAVESDQSQPSGLARESYEVMAQAFTAGKTGRLDHVVLRLVSIGATSRVSIRRLNPDGTPGATDINNASATKSGYFSGYPSFDFSTQNVPITAGVKYAIVNTTSSGAVYWYYTGTAPAITPTFLGGQAFVSCSGCSWYSGSAYGADFVFQTFVNTSTVQQPTISASSTTLSVDEGQTPTATGSFTDPNGDAVTLTATAGAVTPSSGVGSGTWSWAGAPSDEPGGQSVTVTVTDSHGLSASLPLTVIVRGVKPTVQISTGVTTKAQTVAGPMSVPEGTLLTLTGTASSPDPADNAAGFNYTWNVLKDGTPLPATPGASYSLTVADESTWQVTLNATDDGPMTGSTTLIVTGTEILPTARIDSVSPADPLLVNPRVIAPQELVSFAGSFVDAAPETHTATWDFGDGGTAKGFSVTHWFAAARTYTVTLTVSDDDGATGQTTTQVVVQTPQQVLSTMKAYIQGLSDLNGGQKNSLIAKLDAASASMDRGDTKTANNQLNAFLNELQAYQGSGKISAKEFNALVADVHAIKGALGTYNRFLEWWTALA